MPDPTSETPIPQAVRDLLKNKYVAPNGYCAHASVFEDPEERERRADPSFYYVRPGNQNLVNLGEGGFTYEEPLALGKAGAFGDLWERQDNCIAINEHMQHALEDFCRETYEAWMRFEARRKAITAACPSIAALRARWERERRP